MSEHIYWQDGSGLYKREEIVRCRDCSFAYRVFWPESCDVPEDFLNCLGPLVETWDWQHDEPRIWHAWRYCPNCGARVEVEE